MYWFVASHYACPKYRPENRTENERACNNRLNLIDYEKMLAHISELLYSAEMQGSVLNLKNYKWKDKKGTEFKVLEYENGKLVISVLNVRAIKT
jgi:hypothetical protein